MTATSIIGIICSGNTQLNEKNSTADAKEVATDSSVNEPENSSMTQEDVKNKMINSIDYFETASGEFIYTSEAAGFDFTVTYEVSNIEGNYASHVVSTNNITGGVEENYYDGTNFTTMEHGEKTYDEITVLTPTADKAEELYTYDNRTKNTLNGEPLTYYRYDPTQMGMAGNSLFPQGFAYSYLEDDNYWAITGYENYLGRSVVVLEGYPGDYQADKIESDTFKMWVDTETGILLKYESYNSNGEVVERLETTSFELNNPTLSELDYSCTIPEGYSDETPTEKPSK